MSLRNYSPWRDCPSAWSVHYAATTRAYCIPMRGEGVNLGPLISHNRHSHVCTLSTEYMSKSVNLDVHRWAGKHLTSQ